jgi:porphobilinogen synthase
VDVRHPIESIPGAFHLSVDQLPREAERLESLGVGGVLVFGVPESKDPQGSGAYDPDGTVARGLRALRRANRDLALIADVCLCQYTDHGHCGLVVGSEIDNDASVQLIARTALTYAQAGADVVAPSDMMDGRVGATRRELDAAGMPDIAILSYAAKYASAFYGPFRDAVDSAPQFGDRHSYQMDPANSREALREVALDISEGADAVMVKPALPYLDVIARVRTLHDVPVAAYCVSGELAMVRAAAERGWLDERAAVMEMLTAIRRAGADFIVTYAAADAASWMS